ncbi:MULTISPECIES: carbohydrate kinase family protein [Streptomyces]|uniref:Carbohydrate kinase family protein n=2 Tax=Streptomyces TaxID=1883 RepID=A0ABU4K3J2_9ACTN|nr:carbohydrate kinase family protein [Streptomyces roseolus]MDX2292329.1 carbohydrate kinase family protein [Streptomyces roseolus]
MIVCIGDVMVDVFRDEEGTERRHPGGKASIYAVTARALGSPAAVLGCVGPDKDGAAVMDALRTAGADVSTIVELEGETTGADFFEAGDWRMERGANWALTADHVQEGLAALLAGGTRIDAVIVNQGISLEASQAAVTFARDNGLFLVLHLGPEAIEERRKVAPEFYPLADVIVVSQREADVLAEHLGLDTEGVDGAELARTLFDATGPRWALLLSWGVGGARLVTRGADGIAEAEVPASSGPDHVVENYIGANDTAVSAWITWLVQGAVAPAEREFGEVVELLGRAVTVAAVTLDHPGPLTAAIDAPERFAAPRD